MVATHGKLLQRVAIVLISLLGHTMNAETKEPPTGIEGTLTVSPIHGGPSRLGVPDSAPMANMDFLVEAAGGKVSTFKTDENGHFKIELPPGRYTIRIEKIGMKGRGCSLPDIEVTAAGFKTVSLDCDTGMR